MEPTIGGLNVKAQYRAFKGAQWITSCGGRCYYVHKIVSIDYYKYDTVRALMQIVESYDRTNVGERFWIFSSCKQKQLGSSELKDPRDIDWSPVVNGFGQPLTGSVNGNRYERWKALCNY